MKEVGKSEYKDYGTREISDDFDSSRLVVENRRVRERNLSIFEPEYELLIDWWEDSQLE